MKVFVCLYRVKVSVKTAQKYVQNPVQRQKTGIYYQLTRDFVLMRIQLASI